MNAINTYLKKLDDKYRTGDSTEHTHRGALETYLESLDKELVVINEPSRIEIGAPDLEIRIDEGATSLSIGIIECKNIGVNLDKEEKSDQLKRYYALENVILTDYLEFRWYLNGECQTIIRIGEIKHGRIVPIEANFSQFEMMLGNYRQYRIPLISTSLEFARRLAGIAQLIRKLIETDIRNSVPSPQLIDQWDGFKQTLLPDMSIEDFADMYAQTLTYGLFIARINYEKPPKTFDADVADKYIPNTNPFLRELFHNMSFANLGERLNWIVTRLAEVLALTDTESLLEDFGKDTEQTDAVVHFYETFLSQYDPKIRKTRGVYYTPEPVVNYIVRSVDYLLREKFHIDGLADERAIILDPATGTGTFLYSVIQYIYEHFSSKGAWKSYVTSNLLKRLFAFELLIAPYTIAHLKLGLQLRDTGYDFPQGQRLGIYLTNALDEGIKHKQQMFAQFIINEANRATEIKQQKPIMVILGNPPYSGHSANENEWISSLLQAYYSVDGQRIKERNSKWLRDDYVKFIRMAQDRIEKTGHGILAFVTNHSYLDNPTFRAMRKVLLQTFTDIYIIDLHGNSKKKEITPDGDTDKNVFDIQQGVCIGIFVRNPNKEIGTLAKVHHRDLWGAKRNSKFTWLNTHDIHNTDWVTFEPHPPFYLFTSASNGVKNGYADYLTITDIFPQNVMGTQTHRDSIAVGFTKAQVEAKISQYLKHATITPELQASIHQSLYRPYDMRYITFSKQVNDRPRSLLLKHVLGRDNLCLGVGRQGTVVSDKIWSLVMVSQFPIDANLFRRGGVQVCPLYLYRQGNELSLPGDDDFPYDEYGRKPNLNMAFVRQLEATFEKKFMVDFTPEDVFYYTYAILHSLTYRTRYTDFLKIDYPRLPIVDKFAFFKSLSQKGEILAQWHIITHPDINPPTNIAIYPISRDDAVDGLVEEEHIRYDDKNQRIYINKDQYFENISPDVWGFYVGGYQVLDTWLKERLGQKLTYKDIADYQKIVWIAINTFQLMNEIDAILEESLLFQQLAH
ncbi:MAG: type ISP restriction/modification enzyme [bacterium]|nr:type ISP restriction/modification enzyme [bacterium]